jgi:hypothetical protein
MELPDRPDGRDDAGNRNEVTHDFCQEYADRLSPLTRREALKALRRKGVETV